SENGDTVQADSWEPGNTSGHTYRFSVSRRQLDVDPPPDASLLRPATQSPGLSVANRNNSEVPAINRALLTLYPNETLRSPPLAFVPGTENFVLGTDWWLRLFDSDGHEVWPAKPVPGPAWHVNVTADGRLIVAAFGDGTIRWSRASDG